MRIIERKDAKYLLFGILEISEKKRENHSNSEKKHFERKEASQMCLASFHIKRDTEKSISANLGIFLPRQCPCSRTTVLKNTRRRQVLYFLSMDYKKDIFAVLAYDFELSHFLVKYRLRRSDVVLSHSDVLLLRRKVM